MRGSTQPVRTAAATLFSRRDQFDTVYGMIYGVRRTTIYLPEEMKARLERIAAEEGTTEASVIRAALAEAIERRERPKLRLPLLESTGQTRDWAERVDDVLRDTGFGR